LKYFGSKSRIAKYIVPILQKEIDDNGIDTFVDCFCGGCNVIDKIKCEHRIANDLNPYLIALLKHVVGGGSLPPEVPRELYNEARNAWRNKDHTKFEMWELGAIGFLASYNGKDFAGSYAKPGYEKTKTGLRYRDYYREGKDNLIKQAPFLQDIELRCSDYRTYADYATNNTLIYCDPPYANTTQFSNSHDFNYEEFWNTMRDWSKSGAIVYISELEAPDDFECVWEQEVSRSVNARNKTKATEKLFRYKGE